MTTPQQWEELIGSTAVDSDGEKVGKVGQIYVNDETGEPEWVTVSTGLFGNRQSFAPLYHARTGDGELRLAVTKQLIKDAPSIDDDGQLTDTEAEGLYQHYVGHLDSGAANGQAGDAGYGADTAVGTGYATDAPAAAGYGADTAAGTGYATDAPAETGYDAGTAAGTGYVTDAPAETGYGADTAAGARGHDTSGPNTDDAMTRSEERLRVGTENVAAGRARLRKYVVTENVTQTVPVSHEEVRVEREPITDANRDAAVSGPAISEEEHEVTLNAERPVVEKEAVPVERVRLSTDTVTEQHEVNEQVRKEQIEEPDVDAGRDGDVR